MYTMSRKGRRLIEGKCYNERIDSPPAHHNDKERKHHMSFWEHYTAILRQKGRPLPRPEEFHDYSDLPRGHSTFWKRYSEIREARASARLAQAKRIERQALQHKSRSLGERYADVEGERQAAIRDAEDHLAEMKLRKLARMAREWESSSEGKAALAQHQAQYNVQQALQSAQATVERHQSERAQAIANARNQQARAARNY